MHDHRGLGFLVQVNGRIRGINAPGLGYLRQALAFQGTVGRIIGYHDHVRAAPALEIHFNIAAQPVPKVLGLQSG